LFLLIFPIWISWELKQGEPLIDVRISRQRTVLLTNISAYLVGFCIYINMLGTMEILQEPTASGYGFNLTEFQAGIAMVPIALAMPLIAPVSVKFMKLIGPRQTLMIGTLVMAVGYFAHLLFVSSPWQIVLCAVVVSAGTAMAYAPMPILIMGAVPIDETASANGVNAVVRSIGTSSASATVAAVLAGVTVVLGGEEFPQLRAFQLLFVVAAVGALIAFASSAYLPKTS
jgi:MFS family permease